MDPEHGDFHANALIIIPLLGKNNLKFRARALLDSGSGTNFVSSDILPFINYEYLATKTMKVSGINTSESKTYDLVKIFISNNKCPTKEIKCFTLPGIINYNVDKKSYDSFMLDCIELENFLDPLQAETDHKPGLALILGPGAIGDISEKSPSFFNSHLANSMTGHNKCQSSYLRF